ncbi:beta-1,3-glucanase family protein [Zobellia galactanivorans]|uniref:beta-1,3-glucanase family protein n=1 Tax=Zobellia galactanivorans (strain DSM 12802 / CCUG 47099 / CIP 106680 / NCIMB 13871 / Dsij) TaxID=63186 RepID=UPI001C0681B7|nr:beta-1,3-glucanase family protein [Zobellia galactanivorans]MBU3025285.1 carbohydrate-binding protein [Zobellia galactanivorans]
MKTFYFTLLYLILGGALLSAQTLPYQIANNSEFPDDEVYVAVVGEIGGFVWVDPVNGQVNRMSRSDNTVPGPVINGNLGPGLDGRYANCFRKLSDIPNKTVNIPKIAGCRILISFGSPLYLYFFGYDGDPRGYAAPNLENPTDPNQGITFESIELTYNEFGIFNNTSRVDAFQHPIGLEVEGVDFFKKVGELKSSQEIQDAWARTAPPEFQGLLKRDQGIIKFPTKDDSFPADYMDGYIDAIWSKYRNAELYFNAGDAGRWRGRVQGDNFVFERESDGQVATIPGKPTTLMAMEGSGVMASGQRWDLVVQAQMVAAITRHAIDLNAPSGAFQDFGDASRYYQVEPYNWYSKFFHRADISFEGQTYTFAYDDVFDQSSTISTGQPLRAKITLGPIEGDGDGGGSSPDPLPSHVIEAESFFDSNDVQKEPCSEGGENVGYINNGSWMAYSDIDFPSSGNYLIEYRVASAISGGRFSSDLEAGETVLGELTVPNTGGWQNWTTVSQTVNVNAGTYQFGLYSISGGWNINWIRISPQGNSTALRADLNQEGISETTTIMYPNPFYDTVTFGRGEGEMDVMILNMEGHEVLAPQTLKVGSSLDLSTLDKGMYIVKMKTGAGEKTQRLLKN